VPAALTKMNCRECGTSDHSTAVRDVNAKLGRCRRWDSNESREIR
jgi:hypothetical protein